MRVILVVMVFVLAGCASGRSSGPRSGGPETAGATPTPTPTPAPSAPVAPPGGVLTPPPAGAHTVTFALRGSVRRASVTYVLPGGRRHRVVVTPPWSRTFTVADGQSIDLNAHAGGDGELTCTLKVDGDLVKSATSSGGSATVDCGESLGF